jgi:WD40 repeat protein
VKPFKLILLIGLLVAISIFSIQFLFSIRNVFESPSWSFETTNEFLCVDISADGEYIVASSDNSQLYLFQRSSPVPLWTFETNIPVWGIVISSDGNYIVAAYSRGFYVFNRSNPTPLWEFNPGANLVFHSLAISANGQYIAVVYDKLYFFNITGQHPMWIANITSRSVALSSNGHYIALSGEDERLYFINYTKPNPIWSYESSGSISAISMSANGDIIVIGKSYSLLNDFGRLCVFNKSFSTPIWEYEYGCAVTAVDISKDGNYIIAGGYNGNICLFETENPNPLWNYRSNSEVCSSLINYDGLYIICLDSYSYVYMFHRSNSVPIWTFEDYPTYIGDDLQHTIAISSSGRYFTFSCRGRHSIFFVDLNNPLIITNILEFLTSNLMLLGYEFLISIWLYQFIKKYIVYKKQKREELRADLKAKRTKSIKYR